MEGDENAQHKRVEQRLDVSVNAVGAGPCGVAFVLSDRVDRGHQTLIPCLLRPSTQGLLTKQREEPLTASSKVRPACELPFFVLTASIATKEQSLHETKVVVRKKLGLGHDAPIELAQLRDGRKIDLEDGVSVHPSWHKSQSQSPKTTTLKHSGLSQILHCMQLLQ